MFYDCVYDASRRRRLPLLLRLLLFTQQTKRGKKAGGDGRERERERESWNCADSLDLYCTVQQ